MNKGGGAWGGGGRRAKHCIVNANRSDEVDPLQGKVGEGQACNSSSSAVAVAGVVVLVAAVVVVVVVVE